MSNMLYASLLALCLQEMRQVLLQEMHSKLERSWLEIVPTLQSRKNSHKGTFSIREEFIEQ